MLRNDNMFRYMEHVAILQSAYDKYLEKVDRGIKMERKIILLSGVHGVGKGYFLKKNFAQGEGVTILEASQLIGRRKKADDAGHKKVKDISDNQRILLEELESERYQIMGDIILDGHLCMLKEDGSIERIAETFFKEASINGIVLLQDEVENIVKRQMERDGSKLPSDIIKDIQEEELKYCEILFLKHNIPYKVIDGDCGYQQFCEIVKRM